MAMNRTERAIAMVGRPMIAVVVLRQAIVHASGMADWKRPAGGSSCRGHAGHTGPDRPELQHEGQICQPYREGAERCSTRAGSDAALFCYVVMTAHRSDRRKSHQCFSMDVAGPQDRMRRVWNILDRCGFEAPLIGPIGPSKAIP